MLDHLGITVLDFERSVAFCKKALAPLSITVIKELTAADTGANAHVGFGCEGKPFFWISDAAQPHGILHIAFRAANRSEVPVLPHPSQIINHMRHRWYNLPRRDS